MTEKEKMLKGEPYKAFGEELFGERQYAKEMLFEFNSLQTFRTGKPITV